MAVRRLLTLGVLGVAWGAVWTPMTEAQVRQPELVRNRRVATRIDAEIPQGSFYTKEIRGIGSEPDGVLLEHPSNPKSMRTIRTGVGRALVQAAEKSGAIPTQHLFDGAGGAINNASPSSVIPADEVIPPPPVPESDLSIEPIRADEPAPTVAEEPQPATAGPIVSEPVIDHSYTTSYPIEVQSSPNCVDGACPVEVHAYPEVQSYPETQSYPTMESYPAAESYPASQVFPAEDTSMMYGPGCS